ncbi:MAG: potassium channel family protein [Scytonema sp. PMC 1069.18]|nr:potassium channel family protein [Scytonema sp. PMC 1069.18]MEC4880193.1 potassium channel family protein [Scytonema sp. PMC 1070.18]
MKFLAYVVGVGIIILCLTDIYLTVLFPSLGTSILSLPLGQRLWGLFRWVACNIPLKKEKLLSHSGPTLMIITVVMWLSLLIVGFALIVWTQLGSAIQASEGKTPTDFITALYYSGFTLTTLGTGDLTPKTDIQRFLMIFQSALGFSIFTLTITYLLSVYTALVRRNTFALSLHHRSAGTADAAEILARLGASGELSGVQQDISQLARDLINLLESQHSYPALLYFRFHQNYYALPRILFLAMDTVTLIKSALNTKKHKALVDSTAVAELWGGGLQLLIEISRLFSLKACANQTNDNLEQVWRERYYDAVERLKQEGIETAPDLEAGANLYISLRQRWNFYLTGLTNHMAYDWGEIALCENCKKNLQLW